MEIEFVEVPYSDGDFLASWTDRNVPKLFSEVRRLQGELADCEPIFDELARLHGWDPKDWLMFKEAIHKEEVGKM